MKKLLLSGLLLLSMNSLSANVIDIICQYGITRNEIHNLLNGIDPKFDAALKATYLAKQATYYDMGCIGYLKSCWIGTTEYNHIQDFIQIENKLRDRQARLENNTWEQWGWSAAKYSAIILATYYLTRCSLSASAATVVPAVTAAAVEVVKTSTK